MDPKNSTAPFSEEAVNYWKQVDLYVGGTAHAVMLLLYARFWHKALFDLGHVTTPEPFHRLVNQGLILGETEIHQFRDAAGNLVSTADLKDIGEEATSEGLKFAATHRQTGAKVFGERIAEELIDLGTTTLKSDSSIRVDARSFKMSKSRGNVVNPDEIVREYGADSLRLYEMWMGPLEAHKKNLTIIQGLSGKMCTVGHHSWCSSLGVFKANERPSSIKWATVDFELARLFPSPMEHIELACFPTGGGNARGSLDGIAKGFSARGPQQPNYAFGSPKIAVEEIFKSVSADKTGQVQYQLQRKVLEFVAGHETELARQLAGIEKRKV